MLPDRIIREAVSLLISAILVALLSLVWMAGLQ